MRKKMQNKVVIFMTKILRFEFYFSFYFTRYLLKNFMFGPFGSCLLLCINRRPLSRVFLEIMKLTYLPICYLPNKILHIKTVKGLWLTASCRPNDYRILLPVIVELLYTVFPRIVSGLE
jgi:hypothetical protein